MTNAEFKNLKENNIKGVKVSFKNGNLHTGKEESHKGTITGFVFDNCLSIYDENLGMGIYLNYNDVYFA